MKKATIVEKRFFPWSQERFTETLLNSLERLHWTEFELVGCFVAATSSEKMLVGGSQCQLKFVMNATSREIGEGIEVVISVSEDQNSWALVECKKKCKTLLELLFAPVNCQASNDAALFG